MKPLRIRTGSDWCARILLSALLAIPAIGRGADSSAVADSTASSSPVAGPEVTGSDITGRWLVEKKDAIVLIEPDGGRLVGRIVWAKDRDGIKGDERLDAKNPDPELRSRKVLGSSILTKLPASPEGDGWFGRGRIYNPKTGKSYDVKLKLEAPDRLRLRVGGKILGHTTRWTRVE